MSKKVKSYDIDEILNLRYDLEDTISTNQAAALAGTTRMTIISWCRKYKIGRKVAGKWYVYPQKLELLMKGDMGDF